LEDGEIAINQADGKLYYHTAADGVASFSALPSADSTMTGVLTVQPAVAPSPPDGSVRIIGDNTNANLLIQRNADSAGSPAVRFRRTRGTAASPTPVQAGDVIGAVAWHSITTTGATASAGLIRSTCTQTPAAGEASIRTQLDFQVSDGTTQSVVFAVNPTTSNFTNSLTVGGTAVVVSSDPRLTDARTPVSHTHGNLSNTGAIGTTSGLPIITTTSGVLTTGAFGTTSGSFCQGNDARLSDARTPTTHKSTHATGGSDALTPADIGAVPAGGVVVASAGTAGAPAFTFTGDTNTGTYSPGADQWAVATGSTQRITVSAAGDVGIGVAAVANVRVNNYHTVSNVASSVCHQVFADPVATASGSYTADGVNYVLRTDVAAGVTDTGPKRTIDVAALRNHKGAAGTDQGALSFLRGAEIAYGHSRQNEALTPTTTQVVGLFLQPYAGHGTIADMYDLFIGQDAIGTGTVSNRYAIFQQSPASKNYFAGHVGIGTTTPSLSSGVGVHIGGSTLRLGTSRTPASSTATGNTGEICWDASYLYVCVSTNTWRRILHSTW
jgi:hypothetical protein